jgi:hypothetical protein
MRAAVERSARLPYFVQDPVKVSAFRTPMALRARVAAVIQHIRSEQKTERRFHTYHAHFSPFQYGIVAGA